MKGDQIFVSQKQLQRSRVIALVEAEQMTLKEVEEKMGVSYRQAKRIGKGAREKGAKGSSMAMRAVLHKTVFPMF